MPREADVSVSSTRTAAKPHGEAPARLLTAVAGASRNNLQCGASGTRPAAARPRGAPSGPSRRRFQFLPPLNAFVRAFLLSLPGSASTPAAGEASNATVL